MLFFYHIRFSALPAAIRSFLAHARQQPLKKSQLPTAHLRLLG
jgi:hypothetical protein